MFPLAQRSYPPAPLHQRANGCLDIALKTEGEQTRVARFYQEGCLKARQFQSPSGLEVVSMNISGGVAGGDILFSRVELGADTKVVFTSQAAERIYKTLGEASQVRTKLSLGQNADLNYLPQETILFNGFSLDRTLEINFADGAKCVGLESIVFGRTAMGEVIRSGILRDRIILRRNGSEVWRDVMTANGDLTTCLGTPDIGMQVQAMANVFSVGSNRDDSVQRLRDALGSHLAGVSINKDIMLLRIIADGAIALRRAVIIALDHLNIGAIPRVWQI